MSKIAFVYPGQGTQTAGMGRDFYENSELVRAAYEESAEILGFDIASICFEKNDLLDRTEYTQAALVTTCLAVTREVLQTGIRPDMTAGLSLGEYCAISAAGGMSFADAVRTIWVRGNLMNDAVPEDFGGMAAVLGLTGEAAAAALEGLEGVSVANYNCPGQVVITGEKQALAAAAEPLKAAGARRVLPLNVSGPFHSPFLKEAGEKLDEYLGKVNWTELQVPYAANINSAIITDIRETRELLKQQVSGSVRWEQSVLAMKEAGVDTWVEIGPGQTLSKFIKKIDSSAKVINISKWDDLQKLV
ncbi:MAG: ACP S-malonyltransferase [Lachnospiraceae bacterium]|nr:ACP S-malonyltransferase [Lachnospiraceae bacterium]